MGLFGKILLFFNLILAVVVLALTGMDYGKRQSWRYAHRRHEMVIYGLPVNNEEVNEKDPGDPLVNDLTPAVLKDVFANSGGGNLSGGPVKTVVEELDRVHQKLKSEMNSKEAAKAYVLPLGRTLGERQELLEMIEKDSAPGMPASLAELDRRVRLAKTAVNTAQANRKELRQNIAHILVNINFTDMAWRQRCMTVLGMEAYIEALGRQAESLTMMAVDVEKGVLTDRSTFERQYHTLVQTILKESDELFKAKDYLANLTATAAERKTQVAQRETERDDEKNKLAVARADSDTQIKKLKAIQYDLFQLQQKMGMAMQKNQLLEGDLRKLEQKR